MAADECASRIINKFCSYVDGISSLDMNDRPLLLKHLCVDDGKLKWFGSLEELKSFFECSVGLVGKWSSPGGDAKKFVCVERNANPQFGVTWYFKKQFSLIFRGDTEIKEIVRDELLRIASKKVGVENMSEQVTEKRPPPNDDKTISQGIDLTYRPVVALTQHNEVEKELQNINNNELDDPLFA